MKMMKNFVKTRIVSLFEAMRNIAIIAVVAMIGFSMTACSDDGDGSGSSGSGAKNPFQVNSVADLQKIGTGIDDWTLDAHYKQTANIDLAEIENWEPIGTFISTTDFSEAFTGSYDGAGYTITNLTIDAILEQQGLFGCVYRGTVKNVKLTNCYITSTTYYVGGVVGYNYEGTVDNCSVAGDVSGTQYVGGVVGYNYTNSSNSTATVTNSYSTGNVSGTERVGGVVGYNHANSSNSTVTVTNSYSEGDVSGTQYVGGVVGYNHAPYIGSTATVTNSYSTGNVSGNSSAGGVVGYNYYGTVTNSYSTGNVSGNSYVGGVVGYNYYYGTVTNSYSTGDVSGSYYVGGVVGYNYGTVTNCVALNGVIIRTSTSDTEFGRIVGFRSISGTQTNNYARSNMLFNNSSTTFPTSSNSDNGTDITSSDWSSSSWWTSTAGWSNSVWNFSSIGDTSYPQLRNMP